MLISWTLYVKNQPSNSVKIFFSWFLQRIKIWIEMKVLLILLFSSRNFLGPFLVKHHASIMSRDRVNKHLVSVKWLVSFAGLVTLSLIFKSSSTSLSLRLFLTSSAYWRSWWCSRLKRQTVPKVKGSNPQMARLISFLYIPEQVPNLTIKFKSLLWGKMHFWVQRIKSSFGGSFKYGIRDE